MAVETPPTSGNLSRHADVLPAPNEKPVYVREMFDAIAPRYDLLNSVLSVRLHHRWRRFAAREASLKPGGAALDVCTGTGDFAFELARHVGPTGFVTGTDFSLPMLQYGEAKRVRAADRVQLALADTQCLPFASNTFDAVTVGFGIRNVADVERGVREMARVTRPGGRVVILEFTQPKQPILAALYRFYSFRVMPFLGGLVSGRRSAYEYLPSSVEAFYTREALADVMNKVGLTDVRVFDLNLGTVAVHRGIKPL